jgi:hypothetical protein
MMAAAAVAVDEDSANTAACPPSDRTVKWRAALEERRERPYRRKSLNRQPIALGKREAEETIALGKNGLPSEEFTA